MLATSGPSADMASAGALGWGCRTLSVFEWAFNQSGCQEAPTLSEQPWLAILHVYCYADTRKAAGPEDQWKP